MVRFRVPILGLLFLSCVALTSCAQTTPRFDLPLLAPRQAQPDVTLNEALTRIDTFILPRLTEHPLSVTATESITAASYAEGALFIVPRNALGAFAGRDDALALVINRAWEFLAPEPGWRVLRPITDDDFDSAMTAASAEVIYSGTQYGWVDASVLVMPRVAVNYADYAQWITRTAGVNPLAVQSDLSGVPAAVFHRWGGPSVTIGGQFPYIDPDAWAVEVRDASGGMAASIRSNAPSLFPLGIEGLEIRADQIENVFYRKSGGPIYGDITAGTSTITASSYSLLKDEGVFAIEKDGPVHRLRSNLDLYLDPTNKGTAAGVIVPTTTIRFPDAVGDKITFYSHSYKVGVSPFTLDFTSDRDFRFHTDETPDLLIIQGEAGNVIIKGSLSIGGPMQLQVVTALPSGALGQLIYLDHPSNPSLSGVYVYSSSGWSQL